MTAGTTLEEQVSAGTTDATTDATAAPKRRAVTGTQLHSQFPPRPAVSSWPTTEAGRSVMLGRVLAAPFAMPHAGSQQHRRLGVLGVVNWLQAQPGGSWQERWLVSGAEAHLDWQNLLSAASVGNRYLGSGLLTLIGADVIRPGLGWLLNHAPARRGLATEMGRTRDGAAFAELARLCTSGAVGLQSGQQALTRIAVILAAKGRRGGPGSGR